jgi:hypothetical protein
MQVRYQAALRPEAFKYSRLGSVLAAGFGLQQGQRGQQVGPQGRQIDRLIGWLKLTAIKFGRLQFKSGGAGSQIDLRRVASATVLGRLAKPVSGAADREPLFIKKITNPSDKEHLMVLVVAPIATSLHRAQLSELLLPVAQNMRFDTTQFTDLTDGEVALGRYRRKRLSRVGFGGSG